MIGKFLFAWVQTQAALVALVGTRCYPLTAPATNQRYPYIGYFIVSDTSAQSLAGMSGLTAKRVQLEAVAATYAQANELAALIKGTKAAPKLTGYRGTLAGVTVQCIRFENRIDLYDEPAHGETVGAYRAVQDFMVWHEE